MHTTHWKSNADDLRTRAAAVTCEANATAGAFPTRISARAAAKVLSGIISHVARTTSVDDMQAVCATLARNEPTWDLARPNVVSIPLENGEASESMKLVALVAHALLPLAGPANVRAALAFWATEDDPGAWTRIVES